MIPIVLFRRSTIPLDCGLKAVVWVFFTPRRSHISLNNFEVKFRPWSVWIMSGVPYLATNSVTKASATVLASWSGNGYASDHLVKWSVTTRMYLLPVEEVGQGPLMSIATLSMGSPTLYCCMGALLFLEVGLRLAHTAHWLIHLSTDCLNPGQKNLSLTLFSVLRIPI